MDEQVSGAGTGIYEPLKPPFQALTDTDVGPIAMVTSIPLIIIAALTVMVKIWTVYGTARKLGLNDAVAIASIAFGIGYTICLNQAVQSGLGKVADELNESMIERLSKNYFASNILLVLATTLAKATVILLIITIRPHRKVLYAAQGVLGISVLWGLASVVAISLQCDPTRWALGSTANDTCADQYAIQIGIRVTDAIIDLAIVLLPVFMMLKVQTSWTKRLLVITLFATRLCTPVVTLISLAAFSEYYNAPPQDRPFAAITPSIWTSVALSLSIITACIPSIKRFLADWAAGLSRAAINDSFELEHTVDRSRSGDNTHSQSPGRTGSLATKLGLSRSGRAEVTSTSRSHVNGKDSNINAHTQKPQRTRSEDTSDSVKGLTDGVIVHTMDYRVEYEDHELASLDGDGSTSSGRERAPPQVTRARS